MKHKNIFIFSTGLILSNIYFAIEDNKKLNKLRSEIKKKGDDYAVSNEQIINRRGCERIN